MPVSDIIVLLLVVLGTAASVVLLRRRSVRGRRLFAAAWFAFFGLLLIASMAAHCVEIGYHTLVGGTAHDGSPWGYNFRVYALQLLGGLLIWQGAAYLRAAEGLGRGDAAAWRGALRTTLVVLAVVAPLVPIHGFFGIPLTVLALLSLPLLALARTPAPVAVGV